MNQAQNEVVAWWYGRRDYRTGIELLSRYCKNKTIIHTLAKQGKENFLASVKKLNYEVTKAVRLDWLHMPYDITDPEPIGEKRLTDIPPREHKEEKKNIPPDSSFPGEPIKNNDDLNQYPKVIRRLKYEYSNLYNKRSKLYSDMVQVEQTNYEKNNKLRSELLAEIKSISKQLYFYYGFIEKYEINGISPDDAEIWPPAKEQAPEEPKSLPELKKLVWALHRQNSKDGCLLIYQQRKKAEKEKPMPKGTKRDAIELRIKLREIRIADTLTLITQIENAD